jgi:hypothetical protein
LLRQYGKRLVRVNENDGVEDEVDDEEEDEVQIRHHEVKNIEHQKLRISLEDEW